MKRKTIAIFFISNGILLLNNHKITRHIISSVNNYKVINSNNFMIEINHIFKEKKINTHILTDNIKILIDSSYSDQDISLLEIIFKELSFNKIEFINWINKAENKEKTLILNLSSTNIKIYYDQKTYIINIIYNKFIEILEPYLKILSKKYSIRSIRMFGDNESILQLRDDIEKKIGLKTYIYSNPLIYPLELLI